MNSADPTHPEAAQPISARDHAIQLLAPWHLHRCLWLPQNESHDTLRVTFAVTSNFEDESLPAVLYIGPVSSAR